MATVASRPRRPAAEVGHRRRGDRPALAGAARRRRRSPSRSSRTGRAVVVQEAPLTAGFASEVVAAIQEGAFLSLEAPIVRVSGWDVPYPMPLVEDHYVPVRRARARRDPAHRGVLSDGAPVMPCEFRLVDIGEGLTEAEIVSWLVAVGDHVVEDQPVVEIETDKAVVEMPAPATGTVVALGGEPGAGHRRRRDAGRRSTRRRRRGRRPRRPPLTRRRTPPRRRRPPHRPRRAQPPAATAAGRRARSPRRRRAPSPAGSASISGWSAGPGRADGSPTTT